MKPPSTLRQGFVVKSLTFEALMILQKLRIFCLAILGSATENCTAEYFLLCNSSAFNVNLFSYLTFLKNLFFPGIVLFTFLHFNETPAIVTSVVIGLGIVFCGGAVIHNVFVWQRVSISYFSNPMY